MGQYERLRFNRQSTELAFLVMLCIYVYPICIGNTSFNRLYSMLQSMGENSFFLKKSQNVVWYFFLLLSKKENRQYDPVVILINF